MSSEQLALGFD